MLMIDGDYPMAFGGVIMERDLTLPVDQVRAEPTPEGKPRGWSNDGTMASIPEMRRSGMAVALVKINRCIDRGDTESFCGHAGHAHGEVKTDHHAYAAGIAQLGYYEILEATGQSRLLKTPAEFKEHMDEWERAASYDDLRVGMVLGMEGADPIVWPSQVQEWFEAGLRVISLSHYGVSRYSHGTGTGTDGGLTAQGPELLREMDKLGIILDVSHTSDESVRQELDIFEGPVLASHQNCREVTPGERQFPDHQLKRIIERGAVIGHSMDTYMLWSKGVDWANIPPKRPFTKDEVTLDRIIDNIDHVSQLAGNSLHSAIGGDTDGQGGANGAPKEVDTVYDYLKIADLMDGRGYKQEDIENVMWRNWQRFFEANLPG
ncbi:MAG: membrane dipeptidase [Chloroflexi bacterium]|nr:membrane dipeptidase [Chloroflexota bacterium]